MRDRETIDSALRLLVAVRRVCRELGPQPDQMFLADMGSSGWTVTDPGQVLAEGHAACGMLASGQPPGMVALNTAMTNHMSLRAANAVVDDAHRDLCPR
jgi:hypothetical protein